MKKILFIGLSLILLSVAASAQTTQGHRAPGQRTERSFNNRAGRSEKFELRKDHAKGGSIRHSRRNGKFSPMQKRRMHSKFHTRKNAFRFKHNRHHRI